MNIDETVLGDGENLRGDDHPEGHHHGRIDLKEMGINIPLAADFDDIESPGESSNLYRRRLWSSATTAGTIRPGEDHVDLGDVQQSLEGGHSR